MMSISGNQGSKKRGPLHVGRSLDRASTSARVAEILREAIISGELEMGAPLLEQELCENFGISRTPLRQAFFELHGQGLIDIFPYRDADRKSVV